jgi:prolyl 4-hydroxylase
LGSREETPGSFFALWKATLVTAKSGIVSDVINRAEALLHRGDVEKAATLLKTAERSGDPLAARELALWLLVGELVRRDLTGSRALFERAAELGDEYSAAVFRAFTAGGVGAPADWPRAMMLLKEAARTDREAASQLQLIEAMRLAPDGAAAGRFPSETLSQAPEVRLFPSFFTAAECAYLIEAAAPALKPSVVVDPHTGAQLPNPVRTSQAAAFPFVDENPAIHALNRRIAAASQTDVRAGEPLQVLRYAPGEQYRPHSDALPGVTSSQQRVVTFLVYLNEDYEGGETAFPALGFKVRGQLGDGLMFRNASGDGTPDPLAVHAGLPITSGVKHLASRWIRAAPLVL